MIEGKDFDLLKKKSKDYYTLIKNSKVKLPNNSQNLRKTFNLSEDHLKKVFWLPNKVSFEPYIKPFQYKVLNSNLTRDRYFGPNPKGTEPEPKMVKYWVRGGKKQ